VGILKQCTCNDKIQARGLYQEASEFDVQANIVMSFNEVPGCDDNTDGIERRLKLIKFTRKYVVVLDPGNDNHRPLIKGLQTDFKTAEYGAAFLGFLIDIFNTHQFEFEPPLQVTEASKDYIKQNNVLVTFIEEAFDETGDKDDTVTLIQAFELCKALGYDTQLGIKTSPALSQRMKMKNYVCSKEPVTKRLRFEKLKIQARHHELINTNNNTHYNAHQPIEDYPV